MGTVTGVEERPTTQRPSPPFTTSTLQQEANRKLGFSADRTMKAAQGLHDEGLISYHRTDSTTLSQKALGEAERAIKDIYGAGFHTGSRQYQTKVRNAQEAHEAIRPTDFNQRPQQMSGLDPDEAQARGLPCRVTQQRGLPDAWLPTDHEHGALAVAGERCELCGAELSDEHAHLIEPATRRLACACEACALLFSGRTGGRYLRVPRRVKFLADFRLTDAAWEALGLPIDLATGKSLITIWVVVRDDRGGESWLQRQLLITP